MKELIDVDLKELIEHETGERFNREGYIKCPFHDEKTPSMSIKFYPDDNKHRFKCWGGCGSQGDAIDFIMKFKNLGYKEAREYLELENIKTEKELQEDKIKSYIQWQIENTDYKKGYKLLGIFSFVDEDNKVIYYKAKFLKPDGKKETPYYHIDGDKVINKRGPEEIPYNLYNVKNAIEDNKIIVFVEGEKDANTINNIARGEIYVATSIKGVKDLSLIKENGMRIYVIGDTGKAGQEYIWHIRKEFFGVAEEFRIITLPGLKHLGDNKDITDWLEIGHTKKDLLNAFSRSLDLKSKYELQQDNEGIYKLYYDKKKEQWIRQYLTNFQLLEADKMTNIDEEIEYIRLKLKSKNDGKILEKIKESTAFNDLRTFRNMLGMDFSFKGNMSDLVDFKMWVTQYFTIETKEIYTGTKFVMKDDKLTFICANGSIKTGNVNLNITSDETKVCIADKDKIATDELLEVKSHLFRFASPEKSTCIIGTIINNLAVFQNIAVKQNLHHLLMIGEAETGKTTILEKIIAPILNYPIQGEENEKFSFTTSKPFALPKSLSVGNYPLLCDEFKPSSWNQNKVPEICNPLKDAYDRSPMVRGDKNFKLKKFIALRPIIIAGEENYPGQDKALVTRSCIVYLSKHERTEKSTEATFWLADHQDLLNKLGRSLIDEVLEISVEQYAAMRKEQASKFKELKDRSFQTAINIACGIEILNLLLERHGLNKVTSYENYIINNIKEEVLDGGDEAKSVIEQMLLLYNDMLEDGRALSPTYVVKDRGEGLFIKTSEMLNQLRVHVKTTGAQITILSDRDFKKQASKAGYLIKTSSKQLRENGSSPTWYDEYSKEKIRKLKAFSICKSDELEQIPITKQEEKIIEGMFPGA